MAVVSDEGLGSVDGLSKEAEPPPTSLINSFSG